MLGLVMVTMTTLHDWVVVSNSLSLSVCGDLLVVWMEVVYRKYTWHTRKA
jgi:hypothetical protein